MSSMSPNKGEEEEDEDKAASFCVWPWEEGAERNRELPFAVWYPQCKSSVRL